MPWKRMEVLDQRIEFVIQAVYGDQAFSHLCQKFGISRPTGYLWLKRYKCLHSFRSLEDHSRRPKCSPRKTPQDLVDLVLFHHQRWGWGAKKLAVLLQDEGVNMPWITIHRILKRHGLTGLEPVGKSACHRFEYEKPNALWQMDFKGPYPIRNGTCLPLSILDDHSRYVVGLGALGSTSGSGVWKKLVRVFERYGLPEAMLMDHGVPWFNPQSGLGFTHFTVSLVKQDICLIYSGRNHPQTQGKVERFHRTLAREVFHRGQPRSLVEWQKLLDQIRSDYNGKRPHEALGMKVPASRYQNSSRSFNPAPKEWEFPYGTRIVKVDQNGDVRYQGVVYSLTRALTGETVGIRKIENKLLIQYRNFYLKEIDLETRKVTILPSKDRCKGSLDNPCKA